jgi:anhydro-N-acetylmuramic acid kinase
MSGTSMDGVDAALVSLDSVDAAPECLATHSHSFPESLRARLGRVVHANNISFVDLCELDTQIGHEFAHATNTLLANHDLDITAIAAIGSHGQTIFHHPDAEHRNSLQIGNPNVIAELTGINTVADLRRRDMAAGGQGAPLLPSLHAKLLAHPSLSRGILNLGGIANLTVLSPDVPLAPVGFDTGPANTLLDHWIRQHQQDVSFDRDGAWARSGHLNQALLARLLADPYFARPAPKSTGIDYFSPAWLAAALDVTEGVSPVDVQHTLARLTTESVSAAASSFELDEIWVVGGGSHNGFLLEELDGLCDAKVAPADALGVDVDYLEAVCFAWFAHCHLHRLAVIPPTVTGASRGTVLGALYPA